MFDYLLGALCWYLPFAVAGAAAVYYFCRTAPLVDDDEHPIDIQ